MCTQLLSCRQHGENIMLRQPPPWLGFVPQSSSSRMHYMSYNWSATKQRLHPQNVADINRHSVLSGDRIQQCETSSGSRTQISVCKSTFPSAGTAVSLFRAKTVQQRPLLPSEVETWLPLNWECATVRLTTAANCLLVFNTVYCLSAL